MGASRRQWVCLALLLVCVVVLPALDREYTVKKGETLYSISRSVQVPVEVLMAFNGIADASRLAVGTVIRVPAVYSVKKGDTAYSIARAFSVPLARLLDLNELPGDASIKPGDRLYIPSSETAVARQGTSTTNTSPSTGTTPSGLPRPVGTVVWPHAGRHEPEKGKIPGLVFFGAAGDVVRSATAGEVKWAATFWPRGKLVIIKAADGTLFSYAGNREILVNVGDRVSAGAEIARLGENLESGGVRLYFSITDANGNAVDPEKFFSAVSS
jgi:lipoprotein NlpD